MRQISGRDETAVERVFSYVLFLMARAMWEQQQDRDDVDLGLQEGPRLGMEEMAWGKEYNEKREGSGNEKSEVIALHGAQGI